MKIIAIWERPHANPRYGGIFCLCTDGRLLHLSHEKEYDGTDKDGKRKYIETGNPFWGNAFKEEDRFDLIKADYFMRAFGGVLVWKRREDK